MVYFSAPASLHGYIFCASKSLELRFVRLFALKKRSSLNMLYNSYDIVLAIVLDTFIWIRGV